MKKNIILFFFCVFQFLAFGQWNTERILTIGRNALNYGDYVLSIQYFNQVIKAKPYLAEPYMFRAMAKIQLGDFVGGEEDVTLCIEKNPFLPYAYYLRGFSRNKLQKYDKSLVDFETALNYDPNNTSYYLSKVEALEKLKKYELAIENLKFVYRINRKDNSVLYDIGRLYLELGDTVSAEEYFIQFTKLDSTNYRGWSALGLLKMNLKEYDKALDFYNKSIAKKSTYAGDYINRGIINKKNFNFKQALSDFNEAVKYDSAQFLSYYNRALLRIYLGDTNNALFDLKNAVKLDSTNYEAILKMALIEHQEAKYVDAISSYKLILKKYPYFIPVIIGIKDAEKALGNKKESDKYRDLALKIERNKDYYKQSMSLKLDSQNILISKLENKLDYKKRNLNSLFSQNSKPDTLKNKISKNILKGEIQNNYVEVQSEPDFELGFVVLIDNLRRTNLFSSTIQELNSKKILNSEIRISNINLVQNKDISDLHVLLMSELSGRIAKDDKNSDLYFFRAIESASIYDFDGALDDLNKTIEYSPKYSLAYFSRGYINAKRLFNLDFEKQNNIYFIDNYLPREYKTKDELSIKYYINSILSDYEMVIRLDPTFPFAYFNKANILCVQQDYKTAIANYTKAIECDNDFAEAYFNRGLTYLFTGQDKQGVADLSKAGELGIYQAYNLIQRFNK